MPRALPAATTWIGAFAIMNWDWLEPSAAGDHVTSIPQPPAFVNQASRFSTQSSCLIRRNSSRNFILVASSSDSCIRRFGDWTRPLRRQESGSYGSTNCTAPDSIAHDATLYLSGNSVLLIARQLKFVHLVLPAENHRTNVELLKILGDPIDELLFAMDSDSAQEQY